MKQVSAYAGDTLLLYTDGIDEARSPSNEMFGIDGIKAIALGSSATPVQLVTSIRHAVTAHENGRQASDDQTLVAVHCLGAG